MMVSAKFPNLFCKAAPALLKSGTAPFYQRTVTLGFTTFYKSYSISNKHAIPNHCNTVNLDCAINVNSAEDISFEMKQSLSNRKIILVIGGPGTGKGTQCQRLIKEFGYVHVSVGELLRNQLNNDLKLKEHLQKGNILPTKVILKLLNEHFKKTLVNNTKDVLIDGFPRTIQQAKYFDLLNLNYKVVYFECSNTKLMINRLLERAKYSNRQDDKNIETIKNRLKIFNRENEKITKYYSNNTQLVKINPNNTIDNISMQIRNILL